ncbi:MAG: heme exporter protein CcmD [Gammaproteobacteria bacterium]|jgi:heme exporter protein CcmD|nr:heme exporter protein CcmD [Gammaproteobacteria bacterium]MBQ08371.1 heme exporter protein CcmD [Gammaproteobacteria bacterium]MDP6146679.1 heme exporter protein CcmD [Gammaproteobacteria bacterium]HJL79616.1 heme exporter protein CcmD [Gammaproteobacteria bacterium]HJM09123.1 heme exporter protein CcmD [Gammaproteobacteria bacterium]
MSIFDMGDYNFYVWGSVFLSFLILFLTYIDAIKKHKDVRRVIQNTKDSE